MRRFAPEEIAEVIERAGLVTRQKIRRINLLKLNQVALKLSQRLVTQHYAQWVWRS